MKLTKSAKQYAAKIGASQETINKAAAIARADHRGYTNSNDIAEARIKVAQLVPGQEVAIPNDGTTGRVIRREAKNLYLISWKGHEVLIPRSQLGVSVLGRWKFGPANAQI